MHVPRLFRRRLLESLLVIVAVGVAVAAVTAVANLIAFTEVGFRLSSEALYARQIVLKAKADDYEAFYQGAQPTDVREVGPKDVKAPEFRLADLAAVKEASPSAEYAYLEEFWGFDHEALEGEDSLSVNKVTAEFQGAAKLRVSSGSLMSASDFGEQNRVMLLSPLAVERLKLKEPVVGQRVNFEYEGSYTVVGVLEADPEDEGNYEAIVPWTPAEGSGIDGLTFAVPTAADVPQAVSEIRTYADETWGEAVAVRSSQASYRSYLEQFRARNRITAAFASLGLVTAALGIMSLMLARVLRQQRTIGIQRSLGASRTAILRQFLQDSLLLGLFGGGLGVLLGYGLFRLYARYLENLYEEGYGSFFTFSWPAAGAAFGAALLVSLLFGLYPALLASRTRIVDALKEA